MASGDDLLIIAAVASPVVAYMGNIGGFKDWVDQYGHAQPPTTPKPNCYYMGTNCQVCEKERIVEWKGICKGKTVFLKSPPIPTKFTFQQACSSIAKSFVEKCNAGQTSTVNQCPYEGCKNLANGPGCFQCRCESICKSHPNTHAVTDAKGSCRCVKNAFNAFAYPGFDNVTVA